MNCFIIAIFSSASVEALCLNFWSVLFRTNLIPLNDISLNAIIKVEAVEKAEIKKKEGSTLDWGTQTAIERAGKMPDIIYDEGGLSREAMIRVLGKNPKDVIHKIEKIKRFME